MTPCHHPDDIRAVREANLPRLLGIAKALQTIIAQHEDSKKGSRTK